MNEKIRTGIGYDVHAFAVNRKLIIGGVVIPFEKGLLGHSDADVLIHAVCDALLGSLSLGDIGTHFPNTDDTFKDADSKVLLKKVYSLIKREGYILGNLDTVITAQSPKLMTYIPFMQDVLSEILECGKDQISIKATTTERLGFVGREEGISALATVLIVKYD